MKFRIGSLGEQWSKHASLMMEQVKTQIREIKRQRVKGERVMEKSVTRRLTRLNRIEISFPSIVEVNVRREILQPAQSANREKSIEVLKRLRLARSCSETALVIPSITRGCALLCLLTFELLLLFFLFFCFPFFSFFFFRAKYRARLLNASTRAFSHFCWRIGFDETVIKRCISKFREKMSKWSRINMT